MSFIIQAAAAGTGTNTAVASGSIANGAAVILNSDGTVTTLGLSSNNNSITFGAASASLTSTFDPNAAVYDSTAQKIVVVYSNSVTYAVVGTVSGTTITFGTPVLINSSYTTLVSGCFNTTNGTSVFIISNNVSSGYLGYAFTISVSGTVPTIGTLYAFSTTVPQGISIGYDANANKCLIVYADNVTYYGQAIVATVSGSTISYGTVNIFNTGNIYAPTVSYDSTALKLLVFYNQNNTDARAEVATISSTTVTFGTQAVISTVSYPSSTTSIYDPIANKTGVFFGSGSGNGYGVVATISGTNVTFGTPVIFSSSNPSNVRCCFNTSISKIDVAFNGSGSTTNAIVATISGTSVTYGSTTIVTTGTLYYIAIAYDSTAAKPILITSRTNTNGYVGSIGTATNITAFNFYGFSTSTYTTGQTAYINTIGAINTKQTGLTAGLGYYIQNDGTLLTTAGSPSVYAGLATSATEILIKG